MGNFIKLNRKILKWEWWHDIKTYRLFSYMLLAAWWKNGNYKGEPIPRGSFPSSISDLSKETDLSDNEVRTALKHLKSTGEITSKSHSKFTVFTVKNYELYQGDNEQLNEEITSNLTSNFTSKNANSSQGINKDLTSKSQADNEQITGSNNSILNNIDTIKEDKEDNNINNIQEEKKTRKKENTKEPKVYFPKNEALNQTFLDYIQMRKEIKKPMSERAIELAIMKLDKMTSDDDTAIKILEQSIMNSWQGLFELRENKFNSKQSKTAQDIFDEWRNA